jgi:cystathionine gamma-synthase
MRDLIHDPLHAAADLGRPIPDSPHAVSVCLPTWASVIGYEEADPAVTERMQAGYPRFFCHPQVTELFAKVAREKGGPREKALVFPTPEAALAAADWVLLKEDVGGVSVRRLHEDQDDATDATAILFPAEAERTARLYWRFSGQGVSSRLAEVLLAGWQAPDFRAAEAEAAPAREAVRRRLAGLTGQPATNVFLFGSGMAGVHAVQRALGLLSPGRRTAQLGFPYVDVLKVQEEFGAGVHFIPGVGAESMAQLAAIAGREPLAGVYTELPSNPLIEMPDLPALAALAAAHDFPLVADDTVATSVNVDGTAFADVVTSSLTKAFSGVGDVLAGAVVISARSRWAERLRPLLAAQEAAAPLFGLDAVVLEANSRDFPERVRRMSATAAEVAAWLAAHPAVARVHFPTLDARQREAFTPLRTGEAATANGFGMLLSITLREPGATPAFFDRLRISKGPSLGTNYSLACPYTLLAHYEELDWAARCGVSRDLVRVSIGLEEPADLIARFGEALGAAPAG